MRNLIGISGKIGSGKDLVGQIIQYLLAEHKPYNSQTFIKSITDKDFTNINKLSKYLCKNKKHFIALTYLMC